jgi:drug/metabolite transporter (DMT)-like permease
MTTTTAPVAASPSRLVGGLLILAASTGYGLMPLFGTQAHRFGLDAATVMAGRFVLAAAGLWLIVAIRRPARPSGRTVAAAVLLGAGCWTIQSIGYLTAVTELGASLAALLLFTYPVMVVLIATVVRRQRPHRSVLAAGGLVAAGLLLVFATGPSGGAGFHVWGMVAGVVSAATYSGYIVASESLAERLDPFLFIALALTGAAASTVAITVARGGAPVGALVDAAPSIAGLALVSTVVAATTFLLGLKMVGASAASVLSCTEVVAACTVAAIALGERLSPIQVAGCAAILGAAVMLTAWKPSKGEGRHEAAADR